MSAAPTPRELEWLARARELARRARGHTSPNPIVGAVVAADGEVVGEGHHAGPGLAHAEVNALRQAGGAARGATLVCTLEPCSHHGRTPPCTDAVIATGIARVVIGTLDPLERTRGQGVRILRDAGIEVVLADGHDEALTREENGPFIAWAVTGRPLVTLKLATSLDGRIATSTGESRWISGPPARALVHRWRAESDAVAVGIGTALADDPRLTARDVPGPVRQPIRIVFDSTARLPRNSALVQGARELATVVVAGPDAPGERIGALRSAGVEVLALEERDPGDRVAAALDALGARGVQSMLVEGGARLAATMVAAGLVDRVAWVLAPILVGGAAAPGALGDPGVAVLADAPRLHGLKVEPIGDDLLVTGALKPLPRSADPVPAITGA